MPEQFHHFLFGTEIELFRREALVFKTVQRNLERDAAQNLVRCSVFGLDVMDIAHSNDFTTVLFRKFHVKFVHVLLLRNPVIANRDVQVVVVKNLVQAVHVLERKRIPARSHILAVTAKIIARNGDNAFLKFVNRLERHGRNFRPALPVFVAVTHNAEQIVIARFVLDEERQSFKSSRIFLACARRIHVNVATINRLDRR